MCALCNAIDSIIYAPTSFGICVFCRSQNPSAARKQHDIVLRFVLTVLPERECDVKNEMPDNPETNLHFACQLICAALVLS